MSKMTFEQKLEAAKILEAIGRTNREILEAIYGTETIMEATPAEEKTETHEDREACLTDGLKANDLGLEFSKAISEIRSMSIGDRLTSFRLTYRVIGHVPKDQGDRKACTNFWQHMPGLKMLRTASGLPSKEMSFGGMSPVFERVELITGGAS